MWEKGQETKGMKGMQGRKKKGKGLRYKRNQSLFNFNTLFTLVLNKILNAFQYSDLKYSIAETFIILCIKCKPPDMQIHGNTCFGEIQYCSFQYFNMPLGQMQVHTQNLY